MAGGRGPADNLAKKTVKAIEVVDKSDLSYAAKIFAFGAVCDAIVKSVAQGSYQLAFYDDDDYHDNNRSK